MQDFRNLRVWHDALEFAASIYELTEVFPRSERFGLRAQSRSAAVSISSNIAEGCGRPSRGEMARFLGIAIGSASEFESQLYVAERLDLLSEPAVAVSLRAVRRLRRSLVVLYERVSAARASNAGVFGPVGRVSQQHQPPSRSDE